MRLRLNISDVDFQLKINNWKKACSEDEWDDNWCNVELSLKSSYLNYNPSGELLLSYEVLHLMDLLRALINESLDDDCEVKFIEPDLEIDLHIAKRLFDTPGKIAFKNGYMDVDISANIIINFWCSEGLGGNSLKMTILREEIEAIYTYLRYVVGELTEDDPQICELVDKGLLLRN